ncbi:efflux RND transporter periplasmic adaptor subunit [Caldalkalibacillus mannanilyticus]|uniref:efflux RND transporter periplasmic adaptor subunit n=1 Tax=Caldalkalibacillus mannanilyticus TaxID=1418 RepID=UPI0004693377|nr:efflux RND transporter periplasmic adaptor subunit [Caldalkalibacillus mannanilyticus]
MKKWIVAIMIISLISLVGCSQEMIADIEGPQEVEKKVRVAPVSVERMGLENTISAELLPSSRSTIVAEISGTVQKKNVEVGQHVKANQQLLELDNKAMSLQYQKEEISANQARIRAEKDKADQNSLVKSAESAVREREIALKEAENGKAKHEQSIVEAKQNVTKLKTQLQTMERGHEEKKILFEHGSISREELTRSSDELKKMEIDVALAEQQVEQAEKYTEVIDGQIESAKLAVAQAKQQLEQSRAKHNYALLDQAVKDSQVANELAKSQLEKKLISSPISGVLVKLDVNEGDTVSPQQVLAHVEQHDVLHARTYISEYDFDKVKELEEIEIYIPVLNLTTKGKIIFLSTSKSTEKNGFELRIEVNNSELTILPGMTTHLILDQSKANKVISVPSNTIMEDEGKKYVYVIQNNIAQRREVKTGQIYKLKVEIVEGLKEGEMIAVVGQSS